MLFGLEDKIKFREFIDRCYMSGKLGKAVANKLIKNEVPDNNQLDLIINSIEPRVRQLERISEKIELFGFKLEIKD